MYKNEKNKTVVTFDILLRILEHWFETCPRLLAVDGNKEYEQYFKQQDELQEKLNNDDNYDPFVEQLQSQIQSYDRMLYQH